MKAFLRLVKSFCDFFKPKPKKPTLSHHGIVVTEFYANPDNSYAYSVGSGGSAGNDGKEAFSKCQDPEFAKIHSDLFKMKSEDAKKTMETFKSSGSAGEAGSSNTTSSNDTYPGDFKDVDDQMSVNATCTVPIILSKELVNVCDYTLKPKKKLTKKQIEKQNAEIMVEILKWATPFSLRATQLQKASRIRRERFLPLLKKLVKNGKIARIGTGQRGQPYYYGLPQNK